MSTVAQRLIHAWTLGSHATREATALQLHLRTVAQHHTRTCPSTAVTVTHRTHTLECASRLPV